MLTQEIKPYDIFGNNLKTREMAKELFGIALHNNPSTIVFDFSNVEFISRSFAHELITLKQEQTNLNKIIIFDNKCENVVSMFDAVTNSQQTKRAIISKETKVISFDNFDSLSLFLSSI